MTLSKESADAFRQCLRILAPRCTPEERRVQSRNVESYIAEGKWIPALLVEDIALLFYPHDLSLESAMLIKMKEAIETQELISTPMKKDVLMVSDLAAWPGCPPVPLDSPLRYWLPDWMHAPPAPVGADGDAPAKRSNRKPSWATVAMPYMKSLFTAGHYKSASMFYKALMQRAGESDSPFKLVNHELYCTEAGTTVSDGALGNVWPQIRAH